MRQVKVTDYRSRRPWSRTEPIFTPFSTVVGGERGKSGCFASALSRQRQQLRANPDLLGWLLCKRAMFLSRESRAAFNKNLRMQRALKSAGNMLGFPDMIRTPQRDVVWQALADPVRRGILELLSGGPRLTGEICERLQKSTRLSRPAVLRHLELLVQAKLVRVRAEGRCRMNSLDPTPLDEVCLPWLYARKQAMSHRLERLKRHVESKSEDTR